MAKSYDIFLSYNSVQKDWARAVANQLRALDLDVFFAEDTIPPGGPIVPSIESGLKASRRVLLILTPSSVKSPWVKLERVITQTTDPGALKRKLIPILLEPTKRVPGSVSALKMVNLTDPATRNDEYAFLLRDLEIPDAKIPEPPPWPMPKRGKKKVALGIIVPKTSSRARRSGSTKGSDGKNMVFIRGDNNIADFYIDEFPVTNEEYKKFLEKEKRRPPRSWKQGKFPAGKANHPVAGVSFYEAKGYAAYAKKRLPTEEEWEKAAVGNHEWIYPWGKRFETTKCNTNESGIKETTPVTQYPSGASQSGIKDMSGNTWEWVDTWAREGDKKVKGGSYKYDQDAARVRNSESHGIASGRPYDVGFRCVIDKS
jgi:hypothetical protein